MLWQLKYYQISGPVGMCRQAPVLYEKIGDFDCPLGNGAGMPLLLRGNVQGSQGVS